MKAAEYVGEPDLLEKIATEETATTEEEVMAFVARKGHPVLTLSPLI
jgi:CO dehydrogenase/acetyl-CoA synthase beta subunit